MIRLEGGEPTTFTQVRLRGPDDAIIAVATASELTPEDGLLCGTGKDGGPVSFGPLRATLVLPSQSMLSEINREVRGYRVEVLTNSGWLDASLVNVCGVQVD